MAGAAPLDYQSQVRPILKERCFKCHGEKKQKGKLRLDSLERILAGGESGPKVVGFAFRE